jgi:hypothetical protein
MGEIQKSDCISMEKAQGELNVARGTLSSYMAVLHVPRYKFPLDRKAYITLADFDRVRQAIDDNR